MKKMAMRKRTKHKGIYKVGGGYYVVYNDGTKRISRDGEEYPVRCEKRIKGTLQDALSFKVDMEEKIGKGRYYLERRMEKTSFEDILDLYGKERNAKDYILKFEKAYLEHFKGRKLASITRSDLFEFRDKIKTTPKQRGRKEVKDSTVNRAMAGLRRVFHYAMAKEYLDRSPFPEDPKSGLFCPEKRGLRNFFTEAEMIKIIGAAPAWLRPVIITSYLTGMRSGEVRGLRWEHVDLEAGILHLPSSKTLKDPSGLGQRIVMQRELVDLFKHLPGPDRSEWVFFRWDGGPYEHWDIQKPFKALLEALGIDTKRYSWKELRHTTGSLMNLKGAPPLAIKDQLRHTTMKTTEDFYIGSDIEYQREQSERLSLKKPPLS
jgi:integrase